MPAGSSTARTPRERPCLNVILQHGSGKWLTYICELQHINSSVSLRSMKRCGPQRTSQMLFHFWACHFWQPFTTLERMGKSKISVRCCLKHQHCARGAVGVASAQPGCYCSGEVSTLPTPHTPASPSRDGGLCWARLVPCRPQFAHSLGHGCHVWTSKLKRLQKCF